MLTMEYKLLALMLAQYCKSHLDDSLPYILLFQLYLLLEISASTLARVVVTKSDSE